VGDLRGWHLSISVVDDGPAHSPGFDSPSAHRSSAIPAFRAATSHPSR